MSGRELDASEWRAANAVAGLLVGKPIPRDTEGAPDRTYDFDVLLEDGRTIALEVTTPEDGAHLAMTKVAMRPGYPASGLTHSWWLGVPTESQASIVRIAKHAPRHLAVLEEHGVEQVATHASLANQAPAVIEAANSLFALAVSRATALREDDEPQIMFSLHGGVGGAADQVNALVEEHAGYNIDKLRSAVGVDERHLFVSIPVSQASAELVMATLPPPRTPPTLPRGLDTVWVANWYERIIWRNRAGSAWQVLSAPDAIDPR